MAAAHLAYPDLAVDNFFGTDPDEDPESCIQLSEKSTLLWEMLPEMLVNWQTTLPGTKRCSLLYCGDQPLSGMRITLPTPPPGRMSQQISSLDFQMDQTNFDIA